MAPAPTPPETPPLGTLLVVDDNEAKRYVLVRALKTAGFVVHEAETGEEGVRRIAEVHPDLVVLDVKLPGISGLDVARQLRADPSTRLLPIVHLSATYTSDDAKVAGLESGADAYLTAPVDRRLLIATVSALLRASRAEQRARQVTDQLALVLEATSDGVLVTDQDWRLTFLNPRTEPLLSSPRSAYVGRPLWEAFPAFVGTAFEQACREAHQKRELRQLEQFVPQRNAWYSVRAFPLGDGGLAVFFAEVTERKREERRLQLLGDTGALLSSATSPERLVDGLLLLLVPEIADWAAVSLLREGGRIDLVGVRHTDPAKVALVHRLLSRRPSRLDEPASVGRVVRTGRPSLVPEITDELLETLAAGDAQLLAELRSLGLRSNVIVPLTTRDGRTLGALSLVQADSGRQFGERDMLLVEELARRLALALDNALLADRIREAEARFRTLVQVTSEVIWRTDAEGQIVEETPSWGDFTGQPFEAYRSFGWLDAVHPDDRVRVLAEWDAARQSASRYESQYRLRRPAGSFTWTAAYGAPVRDAAGRVVEWVGMNVDISAAKQAEELLRARSQFAEQLIGIASHDLRNPLTAIQMSATLLQRTPTDEERLRQGLARIVAGAQRASRLIGDLLDWTQAEIGGGLSMNPRPTRIAAVVQEAVEELRAAHPGRQLHLALVEDCEGQWDPDRLLQALMNLLSNAVAHSPEGSRIDVRVAREGGSVAVAVHNQNLEGPIPPEALPELFRPFKGGSSAASTRAKSLGLGLYIVDQILRRHGGRVDVRSSEAEGTSFVLRLPCL